MPHHSNPPGASQQENQHVCTLHGERKTNLCELCMESLARGHRLSLRGAISTFVSGKPVSIKELSGTLLWAWRFLEWLFELLAAVFTCLFLMWFVLPESSPSEKRRRDLEWLRRKAADEEWRHRSDANYQKELEEEDYWRRRRDPSYRRAARQANSPYSTCGMDGIKGELSELKPNCPIDAQFAKGAYSNLDNAQYHHGEASGAYQRRTIPED